MTVTTTEAEQPPRKQIPPVLYLPIRPGSTSEAPEVELRRLDDGRVALMVYTALDRLARCCGPHQAWVLYRTEDLSALRAASPFDVTLMDQSVPPELWHQGGGQ